MGSDSYLDVVDPNAFEIHRTTVRDGTELAYVHEGRGGVPLLCFHGWPGTKRIYYRNVRPLADAGFEIVVPDVSGWGDSPVRKDRYADPPSTARDFKALMESLGHERWVTMAFDFGSTSAMDMVNRFPDSVIRQLLWNALVPMIPDAYDAAGIGGDLLKEATEYSDHIIDHGTDADAFAAGFASDEARRDYVMGFYLGAPRRKGGPLLHSAAPGTFDSTSAAFHAQPFGNPEVFRSTLHFYEAFVHPEQFSEPPIFDRVIDKETLFMYGVEDDLMRPVLTQRAEIGFSNLVGPFHVQGGGHFLAWERPTVVNSALICFCRDLL